MHRHCHAACESIHVDRLMHRHSVLMTLQMMLVHAQLASPVNSSAVLVQDMNAAEVACPCNAKSSISVAATFGQQGACGLRGLCASHLSCCIWEATGELHSQWLREPSFSAPSTELQQSSERFGSFWPKFCEHQDINCPTPSQH
jgi:hypothetical protein